MAASRPFDSAPESHDRMRRNSLPPPFEYLKFSYGNLTHPLFILGPSRHG
jgi:hypothetical protein